MKHPDGKVHEAWLNPSPPAWGRGLKLELLLLDSPDLLSPPAWGRGLKPGVKRPGPRC